MTQTPNPPAGWYPQGNQERWWDGTAWSDNFRPLGSEQTQFQPVQPAYGQPQYGQPQYGQPQYGQPQFGQPQYGTPQYGTPQPYGVQPVKESHTARNLLIVFGVICLLFVGGCVAVVAVIGKKVNDAVNDDSVGGPNNPLTITEGKAFEVRGFQYADGWSISKEPVSQTWNIDNLKVTNERGKADRLDVEIKLLNASEIVATTLCVAGDGFEKIDEHTTVTVVCSSDDPLPAAYDRITIQDVL
jgi:hypothetical protein